MHYFRDIWIFCDFWNDAHVCLLLRYWIVFGILDGMCSHEGWDKIRGVNAVLCQGFDHLLLWKSVIIAESGCMGVDHKVLPRHNRSRSSPAGSSSMC